MASSSSNSSLQLSTSSGSGLNVLPDSKSKPAPGTSQRRSARGAAPARTASFLQVIQEHSKKKKPAKGKEIEKHLKRKKKQKSKGAAANSTEAKTPAADGTQQHHHHHHHHHHEHEKPPPALWDYEHPELKRQMSRHRRALPEMEPSGLPSNTDMDIVRANFDRSAGWNHTMDLHDLSLECIPLMGYGESPEVIRTVAATFLPANDPKAQLDYDRFVEFLNAFYVLDWKIQTKLQAILAEHDLDSIDDEDFATLVSEVKVKHVYGRFEPEFDAVYALVKKSDEMDTGEGPKVLRMGTVRFTYRKFCYLIAAVLAVLLIIGMIVGLGFGLAGW